ncbi:MAG TPA: oligosaccharide flippase family protein [Candidatus Polarisedimenticolia bacterium]|nr:oligosaccharide flippase family protein [Candidatus Polarisedimenticolia bacterium]
MSDGRVRGLRGLAGNAALYAGSNLLQRGVALLLVPLYARHFTTGEFGAMDQIYQGILLLILLTSLGLPQGLVRGIHLDTKTEDERSRMLGALLTLVVPVVAGAALLTGLLREPLAALLFRGEGRAEWVVLGAGYFLALSLYQMPLELFKVRLQAKQYVAWSIAGFVAVVAGNVWLVAGRDWGLRGMLLANMTAYGALAAALWIRTLPSVRFNLEWRRLAPLFAFGLPMLPALLGRRVLDAADRYMIPWYHGLDELGVYVMGAKVAAILEGLLLVPFLYAWQPFFYSLADDAEAPKIFARVTRLMAQLLAFLVLAVTAARAPILDVLGRGRFDAAAPIVSILVLAVACNGLQYCVSAGIHLKRRLVPEMGLMLSAAGLNLALNLWLIPRWRGVGAASATLLAYLFYLVASHLLARRVYPVPYEWGRLANVAVQTAIAGVALTQAGSLPLRLGIVLAWIVSCPLLDLWRHDELRRILSRRDPVPGEGAGAGRV